MHKAIVTFFFFIIMVWPAAAQPINLADANLASRYYQNKEYAKAAVVYRELYQQNPTKSNYFYYLNCLWELQDFEEAEKLIRKASKNSKNDSSFEVDLGYTYLRMGKKEKGEKTYQDAIEHLEADQNKVRTLANAFNSRGEYQYAASCYLKGRELFRNPALFRTELGNSFAMTRNFQGMMDEYLYEMIENPQSLSLVKSRIQSMLRGDVQENIYDLLRKGLLQRIQANPSEITYSEMLIWLLTQKNEYQAAFLQAKALDIRYKEDGERIYLLAGSAAMNEDTDAAREMYQYLLTKGEQSAFYYPSRIAFLNLRYEKISHEGTGALTDYQQLSDSIGLTLTQLSRSDEAVLLRVLYAHLMAFHLNQSEQAIQMLEENIQQGGIRSETLAKVKLELADIHLFSKDKWEAALLYGQVEKDNENNVTGHEAKFRKARLAYYSGDFRWAEAQLNILKASTSKLIANDAMYLSQLIANNSGEDSLNQALQLYAEADLFLYKKQYEAAFTLYDSLKSAYPYDPILDDMYLQQGKTLESLGRYAEADSCFDVILQQFRGDGLGDKALFFKAIIQEEKLSNPKDAMNLYSDLLIEFPGSIYAAEARKRFRKLRGDEPA